MSSIVRPEFGESLPTKLGPKWRALGRLPRALIIAAAAVLVLVIIALLLGAGSPTKRVEVGAPVPFQLGYNGDLLQQRLTVGRESLRLETPAGVAAKRSFTVEPLLLPSYQGSIQGVLPLRAEKITAAAGASDPSFATIAEGPLLLGDQPGYEILYRFVRGGRSFYGRRVLLFPAQSGARTGLDVTMTAVRGDGALTAPSLALQAPLREPFESLVIGN
jgi:hypothetical protein